MPTEIVLHWFRRDLRLTDNTALEAAARSSKIVVPVFVFDDHLLGENDIGAPRVSFLLDSLTRLRESLAHLGLPLEILRGDPTHLIPDLAQDKGAAAVFANRDYSPYARRRDRRVESALRKKKIAWKDFADLLLVEPGDCLKKDGSPYTVFTPFSRRWRQLEKTTPRPAPSFSSVGDSFSGKADPLPSLADLGFHLEIPEEQGGEEAAHDRLQSFVSQPILTYDEGRDIPSIEGTSKLSVHLKFGTLSCRQAYAAAASVVGAEQLWREPTPGDPDQPQEQSLHAVRTFVSELCWRDFYQGVVFHFPYVLKKPFRRNTDRIKWPSGSSEAIAAWTEGRTGFPFVDAGMRQLAQTGWMHNRLRMVTASFLTKILLVDWRVGEKIFMQRLVDGDRASNNGGWQWSASTGTDAVPYFRIFNPYLQSKRFDREGHYIRRWIPELAEVEAPLIHEPHLDPNLLARTDYPPPCVDYPQQRALCLELFRAAR